MYVVFILNYEYHIKSAEDGWHKVNVLWEHKSRSHDFGPIRYLVCTQAHSISLSVVPASKHRVGSCQNRTARVQCCGNPCLQYTTARRPTPPRGEGSFVRQPLPLHCYNCTILLQLHNSSNAKLGAGVRETRGRGGRQGQNKVENNKRHSDINVKLVNPFSFA